MQTHYAQALCRVLCMHFLIYSSDNPFRQKLLFLFCRQEG